MKNTPFSLTGHPIRARKPRLINRDCYPMCRQPVQSSAPTTHTCQSYPARPEFSFLHLYTNGFFFFSNLAHSQQANNQATANTGSVKWYFAKNAHAQRGSQREKTRTKKVGGGDETRPSRSQAETHLSCSVEEEKEVLADFSQNGVEGSFRRDHAGPSQITKISIKHSAH